MLLLRHWFTFPCAGCKGNLQYIMGACYNYLFMNNFPCILSQALDGRQNIDKLSYW